MAHALNISVEPQSILPESDSYVAIFCQVHDIEDLAKVGRDHKACPYYAATHFAGNRQPWCMIGRSSL